MSFQYIGKTAIITGAGGAIGRSYAYELAKRGCNIVVNDFGSTLLGDGVQKDNPAETVVKDIESRGGKAIVNYNNVLEGEKIIESAMKAFGSCDILINNAGILRDKSMAKMAKEDWQAVIDVHLNGTFNLCHAVWPIMQEQLFGRIINVGSGAGLYGNFGQANYSSAKMGILGLTNTLAVEGEKYGINVNCVVPVAGSRMTETVLPPNMLEMLDPEHIVPLVAYLTHENCDVSGACFEVGGGWYSQVRLQRSEGLNLSSAIKSMNDNGSLSGSPVASVEDVAAHIDTICDFGRRNTYPASPADAIRQMMASRDTVNSDPTASPVTTVESNVATDNAAVDLISFPSDKLFETLKALIDTEPARVQEMANILKARVAFSISSGDTKKKWILHLKPSDPPAVLSTPPDSKQTEKPNVTLICSDATLLSLANASISPEYAYMRGLLEVKGQMGVASKVKDILLDLAKSSK